MKTFKQFLNEGVLKDTHWRKPNLIGYEDFVYLIKRDDGTIDEAPTAEIIKLGVYNANSAGVSSFEGIPKRFEGDIRLGRCNLSSFEHAPEYVGANFILNRNKFTSLKDIHKHVKEVHGYISLDDNEITSHMLGLMNIKGLRKIYFDYNKEIEIIFNKHLPGGDIFEVQEELVESGYEEYAKL